VNTALLVNGDEAQVEKIVNVGPEEQTIRDVMGAPRSDWSDIGGLQGRRFATTSASALLFVRRKDAATELL